MSSCDTDPCDHHEGWESGEPRWEIEDGRWCTTCTKWFYAPKLTGEGGVETESAAEYKLVIGDKEYADLLDERTRSVITLETIMEITSWATDSHEQLIHRLAANALRREPNRAE